LDLEDNDIAILNALNLHQLSTSFPSPPAENESGSSYDDENYYGKKIQRIELEHVEENQHYKEKFVVRKIVNLFYSSIYNPLLCEKVQWSFLFFIRRRILLTMGTSMVIMIMRKKSKMMKRQIKIKITGRRKSPLVEACSTELNRCEKVSVKSQAGTTSPARMMTRARARKKAEEGKRVLRNRNCQPTACSISLKPTNLAGKRQKPPPPPPKNMVQGPNKKGSRLGEKNR